MESSTLWMGDIEADMDEKYVIKAFKDMGFTVISVKEIFHKETGQRASYCFVDFGGTDIARKVLIKVNGEPIPGSKGRKFALNRSEFGKSNTRGGNIEYSLFVADLSSEVTDDMLLGFFQPKFQSVKAAKIVKDQNGITKGYGFVRFYNEEEYNKALTDMQGVTGLGTRPIKVNKALKSKNQPPAATGIDKKSEDNVLGPISEYPGWMQMQMKYMQQMHQYMQQCQLYAQQAASYAAWHSEQQEQQERQEQEDETVTLMNYVQKQHEELLAKSAEMEKDVDLADPNPPVDVDAMNQEIIDRDDKLFFELEASRWDYDNAILNVLHQWNIKAR